MRTELSLTLLCLPLALTLTACGDDGGGGEGEGTATDGTTGGTTGGQTSGSPTTDPTATATATTTSDTGMVDTGDTGQVDTTGGGSDAPAFRFNSIEIRDPHLFFVGIDVTDTANDQLDTGLSSDEPSDPDPADGYLDLGFVLLFDPLDQGDGAMGDLSFANAQCTAPVETTTCDLLPDTMMYPTEYTSSAAGPCYEPDPNNLSDYNGGPDAPVPTTGPCFASGTQDVVIVAGSFNLSLSDTTVAAQYVGDPANNLVEGNIEGFLSLEDAQNTVVPFMGMEPILADLLRDQDMDGDGWWMHIAFTAESVEWTGT